VNWGVAGGAPWRISQQGWLVVAVAFLLPWGGLGLDYALRWTPLQRQYLGAYLWSGSLPGHSRYSFLTVVSPGRGRTPALDQDVLLVTEPGGSRRYVLSPEARRAGGAEHRLEWHHYAAADNAEVHAWLRETISQGAGGWDRLKLPLLASARSPRSSGSGSSARARRHGGRSGSARSPARPCSSPAPCSTDRPAPMVSAS
jgi:hypothetical protein